MICCCTTITLLLVVSLVYYAYRTYRWRSCTLRSLIGKTIFITGGSSGIGEELTKKLVSLGAKKVIIASRKVEEMERVKGECIDPRRVECLQLDLSKPEEALKKVKEFTEKYQETIDIVINNAGLTMREQFVNTDFATCQYMLNTNCMSHIALTKAFLPQLMKQKSGHFVNVISIAGLIGTGYRTMYSAAKFGTAGFFKSLRPEIKRYGISVTNVYPEFVKTNISKNAVLGQGQAFGKTDTNIQKGIPVDVAVDTILRGIALKEHEVIVGRPMYHIIPALCFLSSTVNSIIGDIAFRNSKDSIAKAE